MSRDDQGSRRALSDRSAVGGRRKTVPLRRPSSFSAVPQTVSDEPPTHAGYEQPTRFEPRGHTSPIEFSGFFDVTMTRPRDTRWMQQSARNANPDDFQSRYERKEQLARGGMGEIELLYDQRIGRDVACKFMRMAYAEQESLRLRFVREACLQGQLEHPSIVPVHDIGVAPNGQPYFTMKRVRGMTLRDIIAKLEEGDTTIGQRFSRRKLLTAFNNVCLTIAFAHERGVVHRDIKPANIMLGDFGETYVLDWGLAKHLGAPEHKADIRSGENVIPTANGIVFGTPGYMAPEQLGGEPESLGPQVDVYALGAVLFELLTLEPLHDGNSREALVQSTLSGVEARASVRCPERNIPPELEAICVKATAFVPEQRIQSVRELSDAIERFLDGDRDDSQRTEMALKHAATAEVALSLAAQSEPEEETQHRRSAMQEVGRALALDSRNESAMKVLIRLLVEPPKEMPKEAREQLVESRTTASRASSRMAALAYAASLLAMPIFFWMGVREPSFLFWAILFQLSLASLGFLTSLSKNPPPWLSYARAGFAVATCLLSVRFLGPLVLMPTLILANIVGFAMRPSERLRTFILGASICAMVVPVILELTGAMSPSYVFQDGLMCILPNAVELSRKPTMLGLTFVHVGLFLMAVTYMGRMLGHLSANEERVHLYNWHLRQLVPQVLHDARPRA